MPKFTDSLRAWTTDRFAATLRRELLSLGPVDLQLHQGTTQGGIVDDTSIDATVLGTTEDDRSIRVRVGVFFTEVVGGCSCGDPPVAGSAYCELLIAIDKRTAEARLSVAEG